MHITKFDWANLWIIGLSFKISLGNEWSCLAVPILNLILHIPFMLMLSGEDIAEIGFLFRLFFCKCSQTRLYHIWKLILHIFYAYVIRCGHSIWACMDGVHCIFKITAGWWIPFPIFSIDINFYSLLGVCMFVLLFSL